MQLQFDRQIIISFELGEFISQTIPNKEVRCPPKSKSINRQWSTILTTKNDEWTVSCNWNRCLFFLEMQTEPRALNWFRISPQFTLNDYEAVRLAKCASKACTKRTARHVPHCPLPNPRRYEHHTGPFLRVMHLFTPTRKKKTRFIDGLLKQNTINTADETSSSRVKGLWILRMRTVWNGDRGPFLLSWYKSHSRIRRVRRSQYIKIMARNFFLTKR